MQHHFDEFSVTDIRHTLSEVWRVVSERRWLFIIPFCVVSTIACFGSLFVPRAYTASTIIKREQDPVFASLIGPNWTQPYEEIRQAMPREIRQEELIGDAIDELNLPAGLSRLDDGTLTPESEARRRGLIQEIASGIKIVMVDSARSCELVEIKLTTSEPIQLAEILRHVRDKYIEKSRRRTVELVASVVHFLDSENTRLDQQLREHERALIEMEHKYPGVNPDTNNSVEAEQTALVIERVDLDRKLEEIQTSLQRLQVESNGVPGTAGAEMTIEQKNPRYSEITQEIRHIQRTITENKTLKMMTEQHPEIRRARALLAARQEDLANTPSAIRVPIEEATSSIALGTSDRVGRQLSDLDTRKAIIEKRRAQIEIRLRDMEKRRALAMQNRQAFMTLKGEMTHISDELSALAKNAAPVQQVLHLEDKNKSIHFSTVRDVTPVYKPSFPDARIVVVVCFGVGIAIAILSVLLAELVDRSYRTVKQLSSSLQIPIIECIDQIRTKAMQRRHMVRSFVVLPAVMIILIAAMAFAGTKAYFDLENPRTVASDDAPVSETLRASLE